ncbi:beta strand repeat-containing protein [Chloroflexota bacterium]
MKKLIYIFLGLVLVLSLSLAMATPAAAQTTYYVATTGSDAFGDGTETWVDNDTSGDWSAGDTGPWLTIQHAIDSASAGDTIIVADGTYTEDLAVDKDNLAITSVNGSANTTIQLVDGVGIDIQGAANNFTLGGATGQGFTILGDSTNTTFNIQLANAPSGVAISYNAIDTSGNATMGISIGAAGATDLTISNNSFVAEVGDGSIWGPKVVNVTVADNTFTGPGGPPDSGYAVEFAGVTATTTSTISGNTITGYAMGIAIFNGEGTSDLTISGNTVSECKNGIRLGQYSPTTNGDMTTVTLTQNTLLDSTIGIRINDGANVKASQFTISNNSISGSTTYGLQNEHASEAVTAECNWWGSASGPEHTGNTFNVGSQGDAVTGSVDYVPWLDAAYPTGASFAPVTVGTSTTYHASIQAGIDAATAGDTITCQTGAFTEDLTVNTASLSLKSAAGSTTIQLVDGVGIDIQGGANNFTLGGATGQGFTILGDSTNTTFNIQLANAPSGVAISYNAIDTSGNATMGISIGAAGATDLTISNNSFVAEVGDGSIWGPKVVNVTVADNTFTGPGGPPDSGYAVEFAGVTATTTSTISGNTITGYAMGIAIFNGEGTSDLTISGNTVSECKNGIRLGQYSPTTNGDMTTVTLTQNTLLDSTIGIRINDGANVKASQFTISNNSISGSTTYGLQNEHASEAVTAECNWWGHASGPYHPTTNVDGNGDAVTDKIDYLPWLIEEGGTCYYNTQILLDGWTLVSTDNWIDTAQTSWEGVTLAYKYTAGIGYEDADVPDLVPVNALYLKTEGGGGIGIVYSGGVPVASSKDLEAGWNLISSAIGAENNGGNARDVLSPLRYVQVGDEQGVGLATLVSQGNYNRYSGSFYLATLSPLDWNTLASITLNPFDGYWVYMNAAKTFGVIPD